MQQTPIARAFRGMTICITLRLISRLCVSRIFTPPATTWVSETLKPRPIRKIDEYSPSLTGSPYQASSMGARVAEFELKISEPSRSPSSGRSTR